jgi:hypothetical protein
MPSFLRRPHRRRWPWVILATVVLIAGGVAVVTWIRHSPARPVSVDQAAGRYSSPALTGPTDRRPHPGVYVYTGTGTDRLTVPSMSQPDGPTVPVTVTLAGAGCWSMRVDYSTHHWQTWDYGLSGGDLVQTGGHLWMLWQVGPVNLTNQTSITCSPPRLAVPARMSPGQTWDVACTGTSTAVKGLLTIKGTGRYLGDVTVRVGTRNVLAHHLVETRTDSGSQRRLDIHADQHPRPDRPPAEGLTVDLPSARRRGGAQRASLRAGAVGIDRSPGQPHGEQ